MKELYEYLLETTLDLIRPPTKQRVYFPCNDRLKVIVVLAAWPLNHGLMLALFGPFVGHNCQGPT